MDRAPAMCSGGHGFEFFRGLTYFLCPTLVSCWIIHLSHFIIELEIYWSLLTMNSTVLILAVYRTPPCHIWTQPEIILLSVSSRSSVDSAPAKFSGGHGFDYCWGLRYFLWPTLVSCWIIHLLHFITELKLHHQNSLSKNIVIYLQTSFWTSAGR